MVKFLQVLYYAYSPVVLKLEMHNTLLGRDRAPYHKVSTICLATLLSFGLLESKMVCGDGFNVISLKRSQVVKSTIFYPLPCKFFLEFPKGGSLIQNLSYWTVFLIMIMIMIMIKFWCR